VTRIESAQLDERTRTHVRDHFRRRNRTQSTRFGKRTTIGESVEKPGREEVSGARRVEDVIDWFGGNRDDLVTCHDGGPERPPGDDRQRTVPTNRCDRCFEPFGLVERAQFLLVGEQDVDFVFDQGPKIVTVSIDAETVGERERHLPTGTVSDPRCVPESLLRIVAIEEIALHVQDSAVGHDCFVDVVGTQVRRDTEIRVHRALGIGSHDDDASPGRNLVEVGPRGEVHADCMEIVTEHLPEFVGAHLADVSAEATETRHTTDGVGGRTAAHFDGRSEGAIQVERSVGVDEGHRTLGQSLTFDERVVGVGDHVDEGVSDPDDVETRTISTGHETTARIGERHESQPYLATTLADVTRTETDLDPHRLPRNVIPRRYELELEPDLAHATFVGRVVISAEATETTRRIVLNVAELDVHQVFVDGGPVPFSVDEESERLVIGTIDEIRPGPVAIDVEFTGTLNDKLRGFYRSTYRDDDGVEHVIACTQMQATDCRRAFPCFDEPDFKAVFAVTLIVDNGLMAVSNGPEIGRQERIGKVAVSFADTMPMSTYLVAFVVGRLDATPSIDVGGVPLRIVHVPGKAHLTDFGLDVGSASLRWFTEYYGIPYADAKIDMIALPDFAAGAMENVGCITYRESLLLVDPTTSTQVERELVADVVSHELAHMWFGDLVTMKWWNGIWLNEAFATFMEVAAVDAYRPDWERWTSFSLERSVAFETDSLVATRSVEYEVLTPEDCEGMFDVLTYQKGGALLRMLEQYLGPERFRDGVRRYLTAHSYGNTETSDLWDSIEEAVVHDGGEPVRRIMDSWIWQPGFPLVTATLVGDGTRIRLTQQRFLFDADADVPHQSWLVPIHVRIGDEEARVLLEDEPIEIPLPSSEAVIVNAGGHGFYRVAYSPDLLSRIDSRVLAKVSTIERYNLVDDAWNAVVAGRLSAGSYLDFVASFVNERDLAVWQVMANGLRAIGRLLDDVSYERFRSEVRRIVTPALDDLGWEPVDGEDDLRGKLRGLLVTLAAVLGADTSAIERCRAVLDRSRSQANSVHPELVAAATTVVATYGDTEVYDDMVDRFRNSDTPQEQLRYLYALAEFDSAELVRRTCELALGPDVKTQNAPFLLARCIAHRKHGRESWEFVRRNWNLANEKFPSNTIVRMIDPVKLLNTDDVETDVQAFFAERPIPQAAKTLEQILERQRVNVALRRREGPGLVARLD